MTELVTCKVYSLRSSKLFDAKFESGITASQMVTRMRTIVLHESRGVEPVSSTAIDPVVVLLTSPTGPGQVFHPDEKPIKSLLVHHLDISILPFCLFHCPAQVRVLASSGKQDSRHVLMDLAAPMLSQIGLLQNTFNMGSTEFSFRAILPQREFWIHSQLTLKQSGFDAATGFLELVTQKALTSKWKSLVLSDNQPDRVGYLLKLRGEKKFLATKPWKLRKPVDASAANGTLGNAGVVSSSSTASNLSDDLHKTSTRRWFVLKGIFLAYFKNKEDLVPHGVIPLDYYIVRLVEESKKNERALYLDRAVRCFSKSGGYILTSDTDADNDLRSWFQATNGRCANTALNRVFGMPLLHQLCHEQAGFVRKPEVDPETPLFAHPPFLSQCVTFLKDKGLDTEGLFRLTAVSHELLAYRELFDAGADVDFTETSPHTVAGLIKAWLRELPEPLIPSHLYPTFLSATRDALDPSTKTQRVLAVVRLIPLDNLRTLIYIIQLFYQLVQHEQTNKISLTTLALILGPNILRASEEESKNPIAALRETPLVNDAVRILVDNLTTLVGIEKTIIRTPLALEDSGRRAGKLFVSRSVGDLFNMSSAPSQGGFPISPPKINTNAHSKGLVPPLSIRKTSTGVIRTLDGELPPLPNPSAVSSTSSAATPTNLAVNPHYTKSDRSQNPNKNDQRHWKPGCRSGYLTPNMSLEELSVLSVDSHEDLTIACSEPRNSILQDTGNVSPLSPLTPRDSVTQYPLFPLSVAGGEAAQHNCTMEAKFVQLIHLVHANNEVTNARILALETKLDQEVEKCRALEQALEDLRPSRDRSPRRWEVCRDSLAI